MAKFSDRIGITTPKSIIQTNFIDDDLANALWNALNIFYFDNMATWYESCQRDFKLLWFRIEIHYFKGRVDEMEEDKGVFMAKIKRHYFNQEWFEVYNFIEFVKNSYEGEYSNSQNEMFVDFCNKIFKAELSGFRFLGGQLAPITTTEEVESIEEAMNIPDTFKSVKTHISKSLQLLSNKTAPDYKNSIKESISGVESICKILTKNKNASLGDALKIVANKHGLHPTLKKSFDLLYGYTSEEHGIRHGGGLLEEPNLGQDEAIFMLVACSAFINYLKKKIPLSK